MIINMDCKNIGNSFVYLFQQVGKSDRIETLHRNSRVHVNMQAFYINEILPKESKLRKIQLYKIGFSRDPNKRVQSIRPNKYNYLSSLKCCCVSHGYSLERVLMKVCSDFEAGFEHFLLPDDVVSLLLDTFNNINQGLDPSITIDWYSIVSNLFFGLKDKCSFDPEKHCPYFIPNRVLFNYCREGMFR